MWIMDPTRHQGMVCQTRTTQLPFLDNTCHQNGGRMHRWHGRVFSVQNEIINPISSRHRKQVSTIINGGHQ